MVPVNGKPFLEYVINLLSRNGLEDCILCVGYLGEKIEKYFGNGERFGVRIRYSYDGEELLGPAGALRQAGPLLEGSFFVTYGDAYLRLEYKKVMSAFLESKKLGLMVVYKNQNRLGRSDVEVNDGYVTSYDKKIQTKEMVWINFGVSALKKEALNFIPPDRSCGEEEFYGELIKRHELIARETSERFYEIGTPQSLEEFEGFLSSKF